MPEKIGSDVLGGSEASRISPKKRKELEQKLREELAKKRAEERKRAGEIPIEELPTENIPGEIPHEATPEERGQILEKEQKKKGKTVRVRKHYRRPPSSEEQAQAEEI